jgi:hypothetical protein
MVPDCKHLAVEIDWKVVGSDTAAKMDLGLNILHVEVDSPVADWDRGEVLVAHVGNRREQVDRILLHIGELVEVHHKGNLAHKAKQQEDRVIGRRMVVDLERAGRTAGQVVVGRIRELADAVIRRRDLEEGTGCCKGCSF